MAHEGTHVCFITTVNLNAPVSFDSYIDAKGERQGIQIGTEKNTGYPIFKRFHFTPDQEKIWIAKGAKKEIKFLEESPFCEGSELAGNQVFYKRLDITKDAKLANDLRKKRNKAITLAESLEGQDLKEMAVLCGTIVDVEDIQRNRVGSFAEANPDLFIVMYESPDRKAKSVLRAGIESGVVHLKGKMVMWMDVMVGSDEDEAIVRLMKDQNLIAALDKAIKAKK